MLEVAVMRYLDLGVILAYLIGITWFGARFRDRQKSLRDYLLGGRTAPWWAIALSIVSAETSTLTIVGTPSRSFTENLGFLQLVFGYLLAGMIVGPHISIPLVADPQTVRALSELGVILLMFSLGLEFSIRKLVQVSRSAGLVALFDAETESVIR